MTKALGNPGQKMVIRKRIFAMIFPIVIENVLQLLASLVSMGMLGRISTIAVSAQGVASLLTGIIWNLFKGITIGATVLIANAYGAQDEKRIRVVAQQTLLSLVAVAFVLQFIVRWSARPLLSLFNPDPVIMDNALIYLKTVTYGFPFLAVMLCVTGFLQGKGDAKTPMYIALIMNVVNIIVSSVLIFGWFGIPQQGLRGSALGLICSEISGAICGFYVLFRKGGMLHKAFTRENFSFQPKVIAEVFRVGFPSALETIFWHMASIILSRVMLSFGDVAFAANQLGLQAESISETPALGFGVAATSFSGHAIGACDKELGKQYIKEIQRGALLVISVGTCILLFFPSQVMSILTNDPRVIELGAIYLRLMGLIQIPQNLQRVYSGALKGAGYTKIPMVIAAVGLWGIRVPLSLILTGVFHASIVALWAVVCVDQTARFVLSYIFYKKKKIWENNE